LVRARRAICYALNALRSEKPRALKVCQHEGYRIDLYFKRTCVVENTKYINELAAEGRVVPLKCGSFAARLKLHTSVDGMESYLAKQRALRVVDGGGGSGISSAELYMAVEAASDTVCADGATGHRGRR
jgi:hypothetical protein